MTTDNALTAAATTVVETLSARGLTVTTAESCTGGWVAKVITDVAGSSAVFELGIVSYSNAAKAALLAVPESTLEEHGAVSAATVEAMVSGAIEQSGADVAVAVSGIAGPGGGSDEKPVGTVWFACGTAESVCTDRQYFDGDREHVRRQSVLHSLAMIQDTLDAWS